MVCHLQLVLVTAQKRAALGECEARHQEILQLEQNIRVRNTNLLHVNKQLIACTGIRYISGGVSVCT